MLATQLNGKGMPHDGAEAVKDAGSRARPRRCAVQPRIYALGSQKTMAKKDKKIKVAANHGQAFSLTIILDHVHFFNTWDVVHPKLLEGGLQLLVIRRCGAVHHLLLSPSNTHGFKKEEEKK